MSKPYADKVNGRFKTRTFESNTDSHELVWHRDKADRVITVLEGNGWMFQMDNGIPYELEEGDVLNISKMSSSSLVLLNLSSNPGFGPTLSFTMMSCKGIIML